MSDVIVVDVEFDGQPEVVEVVTDPPVVMVEVVTDVGPPGPPGPEGMPGGGIISSTWAYHNSPLPPPEAGEIRTSSPVTAVYVADVDSKGFSRRDGLSLPVVGDTLRLKGSDGSFAEVKITATPIDHDTWWEYPVVVLTGNPDPKKGTVVELQILRPPEGTEIVAVPAASWPPSDPQPDVLYLKVE